MAQFKFICVNPLTGERKNLLYDNMDSTLTYEDGSAVVLPSKEKFSSAESFAFDAENPKMGKFNFTRIKIQMGLTCNYSCTYCSQKFVPHSDESSFKEYEKFLELMPSWTETLQENGGEGVTIEFWGGEPFVYWKTMKPLAEGIRAMYPNAHLSVITNGSLLTLEKVKWLEELDFSVSLSHDGPGQPVRGDDPLDNPVSREAIQYLIDNRAPIKKFSFNPVFTIKNYSRSAVIEWFKQKINYTHSFGEGDIIDAYDSDGSSVSIKPSEMQHIARSLLTEMRAGLVNQFNVFGNRENEFVDSIAKKRLGSALHQKCGLDREDYITVNLSGEVLTCQNVSSAAVAQNGESHAIGTIHDLPNVALKSGTHWKKRDNCSKCPVLQTCRGSCLFLQGELFETSCNNSFVDNVASLASSIDHITNGFLLLGIEGEGLPNERIDPFGYLGLTPVDKKKKVLIPIKAV